MKISKKKIMLCMAKKNLTCKELASRIDMQPNNLSTVLTRETCRPQTATRIADGLDVDVTEIIKEE